MKNRDEIKKKIQSMSEDQFVDLFLRTEEADWYKEQLAILNKLRFSSKSEKNICGQLNLFNEVEDIHDTPVEEAPIQNKS